MDRRRWTLEALLGRLPRLNQIGGFRYKGVFRRCGVGDRVCRILRDASSRSVLLLLIGRRAYMPLSSPFLAGDSTSAEAGDRYQSQ